MYISDWVPPGTQEDSEADVQDDGVRHPLVVLTLVVAIAVAVVLGCGYAGYRFVCATHATVEPC